MASELANPFDPRAFMPGSAEVPRGLETGQPRRPYVRAAQHDKFFVYLHTWNPLGAGALQSQQSIQIDGDAEFHVRKIAVMAQNRGAKVQILITPVGENYLSNPVFLSHLGSGRFPLQMSSPIIIPRNGILAAILDDRQLAAATDIVFIAYHGAKVYRTPRVPARPYDTGKWYGYVANFTADNGGLGAIAAGATAIFTLRTDGDSDFDIQKMTVTADAPITLDVESDHDRWFQTALRGELLGASSPELTAGSFSGELPFTLPAPRLIPAAGYITATVANLDLVNVNRVQITFWGTRRYPAGGLR